MRVPYVPDAAKNDSIADELGAMKRGMAAQEQKLSDLAAQVRRMSKAQSAFQEWSQRTILGHLEQPPSNSEEPTEEEEFPVRVPEPGAAESARPRLRPDSSGQPQQQQQQLAVVVVQDMVGRCRLTVTKPVLKAPMVTALETTRII